MTREKIAAIDRECEEQYISQQDYLDSHGIAKHQYYRWKRKYREEDEQSLVPAGFVPMMPGTTPVQSVPAQRSKGKQHKPQDQESVLPIVPGYRPWGHPGRAWNQLPWRYPNHDQRSVGRRD